jgi:electron transport complex protein RnfE
MLLPPGGFFVFGVLVAVSNKLATIKGKEPINCTGCGDCPMKGNCTKESEVAADVQ